MSIKLRLITASLVLALAACGDDDSTGPNSDLIGAWTATEVELVSVADPQVSEELIGQGGALEVELNANATFAMTITFPGEAPEDITGTWSASQDVLTVQFTQSGFPITWQFDYVLAAGELTLTGADALYDFDGDTIDEPATLNVILASQ